MEIKTLVYIGVLLIIISISVNVYLSWDKIKQLLNHKKDSKNFEEKVKKELTVISRTIENDLKNTDDKNNKDNKEKKDNILNKDNKVNKEKENVNKEQKKVENDNKSEQKQNNTTEIDKEIEKLNNDLKKLENEILKEENNLLSSSNIVSNVSKLPTKNSDNNNNQKEVYLVKSNIFRKSDANSVCKALFNGEIASKSQIHEAGEQGANWCNYGWANDNNAYYPLNQDIENSTCSGKKGLNGGNLPNSDNFQLGINCYGVKPDLNKYSSLEQIYNMDMFNELEREKLDKYKKKLNKGEIKLEPYNPNQWSKYSYKKDTITINNNTIVTTTKTETSKDPSSIKVEKNKIDTIIKTN
jgi:chemotaxis protein histidine kinase CheA